MKCHKKIYNEFPEIISIPKEFIHKKGEIIFIADDETVESRKVNLKDFFGMIPDFPERSPQQEAEKRDRLWNKKLYIDCKIEKEGKWQ